MARESQNPMSSATSTEVTANHSIMASPVQKTRSMQLAIDTTALQPDLLGASLLKMVPDTSYRETISGASPQPLPSAQMEGPVLERWARTVAWNKVEMIVALGLGSGLLIDLVRARSDAPLLVFEPRPEVINEVLSRRPLLSTPNVKIFESVIHLRGFMRNACRFGDRVMLFAPSWAKKELEEHVPEIEQTIKDAHQLTSVNTTTEKRYGKEWNDLILDGLDRFTNRVPINRLPSRALEGVPGVLVAAGPSLDNNIDVLAEIQDRVAICALNSSLSALDKKGIQPDILATVESKDIYKMIASSPSVPRVIFAPGLHTNEKLFSLPFHEIMPAMTGFRGSAQWVTSTLGITSLSVGGSVACLGFSILVQLGCDPIILIGQDCALKDERMYAEGTPMQDLRYEIEGNVARVESNRPIFEALGQKFEEEQIGPGEATNSFPVPGWDGSVVRTIPQLDTYRLWFEERALELHSKKQLINATEGGARINGFESRRLRDVADELPLERIVVAARIEDAAKSAAPIDSVTLAKSLRGELEATEEAQKLALEGLKTVKNLLKYLRSKKTGTKKAQKELRRLSAIETDLCQIPKNAQLLDAYVGVALEEIRRRAVREQADSPEQGTRQSLEHTRAIFQEIASTAADLAPRLEDVALKLEKQGRN